MAQAFGGNRGSQPIPAEKGVFPLDHLQEAGTTTSHCVFQLSVKDCVDFHFLGLVCAILELEFV